MVLLHRTGTARHPNRAIQGATIHLPRDRRHHPMAIVHILRVDRLLRCTTVHHHLKPTEIHRHPPHPPPCTEALLLALLLANHVHDPLRNSSGAEPTAVRRLPPPPPQPGQIRTTLTISLHRVLDPEEEDQQQEQDSTTIFPSQPKGLIPKTRAGGVTSVEGAEHQKKVTYVLINRNLLAKLGNRFRRCVRQQYR